jgi:prepilin-type N-terminal cleavage/methylation domain-containing protein/prepilin-type processing-associated H-X9-DG protein
MRGRKNTPKSRAGKKRGFTLIELLVVIGIIALLAAILMPSLANARELAKGAACLSNLKNIGSGLMVYNSDNKGFFPSSYHYINGASSGGGYHNWTSDLTPDEYTLGVTSGKYPKYAEQFICPSHTPGGWAPSNFTTTRIPVPPSGQASQDTTGTVDDQQAPRLSYLANEAIMPRKKFSASYDANNAPGTSNLRLVSGDEIQSAAHTILLAEFSNSSNCIWGSSVGGGSAFKSHRPTNGVKSNQPGGSTSGPGVFDGEGYTLGTQVWKLTFNEANDAINAVLADKVNAINAHHIAYINSNAHKTGSNYTFADGHAAKVTLSETLDPADYMWGRKMYSCADEPVIQDNP